MFEYMLATEIAKLEAELLESEIARRYRNSSVRNEEKQLLTSLAAAGSHVLQSLGGALISASERLNRRTPDQASAA
jgi:shikimate kinase